MNALVVVMDLTGVALIFLALPVLVFPLLEEALSTTVPTAVEDDLDGHVIICTHSPRSETLISELESWDVRVVSVVEEPERATNHEFAGADVVLSPRALLGEGLARKVTTAVSTELGDAVEVGEDLDIAEFPIHRGSELVGRSLAESGIRQRAGVNVIGVWFRGDFESPRAPEATPDGGTVLLVAGQSDQLGLRALTLAEGRRFTRGETVVPGYGQVGRTVAAALDDAGLPRTVLDLEEKPGVDLVGDATDPAVLERAGVADAGSVILTSPDDTTAEFATLVVRDASRSVETSPGPKRPNPSRGCTGRAPTTCSRFRP